MSFTPEQIDKLQALLDSGPGPEPVRPDELPPPPRVVIPDPPPTSPAPAAAAKESRRAKLYASNRRGFMRSTREEGIRDELSAMTDEARGSPFFDAPARTTNAEPLRQLGIAKSDRRGGRK